MKNKKFAFRISENDLNMIRKKAKNAEMTVTDYFTTCALEKEIVVINGLPEVTKELKAIGRNLNQLTTLANMGRIKTIYFDNLVDEFKKIHQALSEIAGRK